MAIIEAENAITTEVMHHLGNVSGRGSFVKTGSKELLTKGPLSIFSAQKTTDAVHNTLFLLHISRICKFFYFQ